MNPHHPSPIHRFAPPPLRRALAAIAAALLLAPATGTAAPAAGDFYDADTVRDLDLRFADPDWESRLPALPEGQHLLAQLSFEDQVLDDVGVSLKGNSSSRAPGRKKPLNLTLDAVVKGQKLMGYDVVNLNNGFADPSFVRETLVSQQLRPYLPMPRAGYVDLAIGEARWGLFTSIQQIEGSFIKQWFPSADGILFKGDPPESGAAQPPLDEGGGRGGDAGDTDGPSGHGDAADRDDPNDRSDPTDAGHPAASVAPVALPAQRPPGPGGGFRATLRYLGEDLAAYRQAYELKTDGAGDEAYALLRELTRVLDAPVAMGGVSDADFPAAIQEVLDVDEALWYLAAINLFTNYDSYYAGHNYFLYRAPEDGRFRILLWDVNESFGVFPGAGISPSDSTAVARTDPYLMASGQQAVERPLIRRLLAVPAFRADYLAHLRSLRDLAFQPADLAARIAVLQDTVRADLAADPNRIYGMDLFAANAADDVTALGRAIPGILKVARLRQEWLGAHADLQAPRQNLLAMTVTPASPAAGEALRIDLRLGGEDRPASVDLVLRVDDGPPQTLAMQAGADGLWSAALPGQAAGAELGFYARLAFADGRSAFHPEANWTQPWRLTVGGPLLPPAEGPLVINEVLADNQAGDGDEAGEREDWVELVNRAAEPVALSGFFLSDDPLDPWAFPLPDLVLAPGAFYRVWCDEDLDQGPAHASFKLAKGGESVLLSRRDGLLDRVDFPALGPDQSYARLPDGTGNWRLCDSPSGGAANRCGEAPTPAPSATVSAPSATPPGKPTASATPQATRPAQPGWRLYLPLLRR